MSGGGSGKRALVWCSLFYFQGGNEESRARKGGRGESEIGGGRAAAAHGGVKSLRREETAHETPALHAALRRGKCVVALCRIRVLVSFRMQNCLTPTPPPTRSRTAARSSCTER